MANQGLLTKQNQPICYNGLIAKIVQSSLSLVSLCNYRFTLSPMNPIESHYIEAFLIALTQVESLEEEVQTQLKTLTLPANFRQLDEIIKQSTTLSEPYQQARQKLDAVGTTRNKGGRKAGNEAQENRALEKTNLSVEIEAELSEIGNQVLQSPNLVEAAKNSPEINQMALIMSPA
jgi:DNA-binding NtrC family response regulator